MIRIPFARARQIINMYVGRCIQVATCVFPFLIPDDLFCFAFVIMESWESYYCHSDPTGAYSHGDIRYSRRPETRGPPRGEDISSLSEDVDEGVDEHDEEPLYDLDDPD